MVRGGTKRSAIGVTDENMRDALLWLKSDLVDKPAEGKAYDIIRYMVDETLKWLESGDSARLTVDRPTLYACCATSKSDSSTPNQWAPHIDVLRASLLNRAGADSPSGTIELGYAAGKGKGNHSLYWLQLRKLDTNEDIERPSRDIHSSAPAIPEEPLAHYSRTNKGEVKPGFLVRWLLRDGELRNRSRQGLFLLGSLFLGTVIWTLMLAVVLLGIAFDTKPLNAQQLISGLVALAGFWFVWRQSYEPWFRLINDRVVKAPVWVPALLEDACELEMYRHDKQKWIRLVRFTADCPLCGGQIELMTGHPEHHLPLVGRCLEAPHAHVFSFDRTRMLGAYIGPPIATKACADH